MNKTIEIQNLSLGYKRGGERREIFPAFSAVAQSAQSVAVVGRNGTGKSTLLRTLAGLQNVFSGNIFINGNTVTKLSLRQYATLVSYVSTESVSVMHLKVFDLAALGRFTYTGWLGKLSNEDEKIVSDALHMVGMQDFAQRNVSELSDGERQRVMIARALVQDTPIMILDEPTAFLDIPNKYEVMKLLQTLAREKQKTIIYSTHDLNIALALADKIWFLNNRKFTEGTPAQLQQADAFADMLEGIDFTHN